MADEDDARLSVVISQSPPTLLWTAALLLGFSMLLLAVLPTEPFLGHVLDAVAAAVLASAAWLIRRRALPAGWAPWLVGIATALLGLCFLGQLYLHPNPVGFAYVAVVLTGMGPMLLDRPAYLTCGGALLLATFATALQPALALGPDWAIPALAGFGFGLVLLVYRLRGLAALDEAQATARRLAEIDRLTGLLNRHGFDRRCGDVLDRATAEDQDVYAMFVDVDGLKRANDEHGHAFGDAIIRAAAAAVIDVVPSGDLVSRWGGDEIVVLGAGSPPDPDDAVQRLDGVMAGSGLDRTWWPGPLSVGIASGRPTPDSPYALVDSADRDMYLRRQRRRGDAPMAG